MCSGLLGKLFLKRLVRLVILVDDLRGSTLGAVHQPDQKVTHHFDVGHPSNSRWRDDAVEYPVISVSQRFRKSRKRAVIRRVAKFLSREGHRKFVEALKYVFNLSQVVGIQEANANFVLEETLPGIACY